MLSQNHILILAAAFGLLLVLTFLAVAAAKAKQVKDQKVTKRHSAELPAASRGVRSELLSELPAGTVTADVIAEVIERRRQRNIREQAAELAIDLAEVAGRGRVVTPQTGEGTKAA